MKLEFSLKYGETKHVFRADADAVYELAAGITVPLEKIRTGI